MPAGDLTTWGPPRRTPNASNHDAFHTSKGSNTGIPGWGADERRGSYRPRERRDAHVPYGSAGRRRRGCAEPWLAVPGRPQALWDGPLRCPPSSSSSGPTCPCRTCCRPAILAARRWAALRRDLQRAAGSRLARTFDIDVKACVRGSASSSSAPSSPTTASPAASSMPSRLPSGLRPGRRRTPPSSPSPPSRNKKESSAGRHAPAKRVPSMSPQLARDRPPLGLGPCREVPGLRREGPGLRHALLGW